jgi:phosphohistidine phosphatase SixA
MKQPILLALLALLALLVPALLADSPPPPSEEPAKPVTVILLRHAEKEVTAADDRDPALSEVGVERAEALSLLFVKAGVTHLFSSQFRRTKSTLEPLAGALGLDVEVIDARNARRQIAILRALPPGSVAVVAGHSNTVPAFVAALGGELRDLADTPHGKCLGEDEYDRVFLVTLPVGEFAATQVIELRYGE